MTLLRSIYQRQLHGFPAESYISSDFAVKSFSCHRIDEHIVRGRDDTMEVPPFASRFSDSQLDGHLLACADEDGSVRLFDTRKYGARSIIKEWTAHYNAIFDIAWMEGHPKLVTASGDQSALLWDVERGDLLTELRGHTCSLKSVNFRRNDIFIIGTGARDGKIMIWDIRCNRRNGHYKPVNVIHNAHMVQRNGTPQQIRKRSRRRSSVAQINSDCQQSVTSVIFQDDNKLISAGAMDGNIKVWDLRRTYTTSKSDPKHYHRFPYPGHEPRKHGFSSLVLDSTQSKLFASCTNDKIYMYECTVLKDNPIAAFTGHSNSTFYVKSAISPDDNYLLSGSSDNDAYLWNVKTPQAAPMVLKGHTKEVTSVDWCTVDVGKLVTCGDDNNIRIWRMNRAVREKTDIIGWCEDSTYKLTNDISSPCTKSNATPLKQSVNTSTKSPANLGTGSPPNTTKSPLLRTPGRKMMFFPLPPSPTILQVFESSSSPTSSPTSTKSSKQQLLSSWLRPSKENTNLSQDNQESSQTCKDNTKLSLQNEKELAKGSTNIEMNRKVSPLVGSNCGATVGAKNKRQRSLFHERKSEDENETFKNSGKRIQGLQNGDSFNEDVSLPAKKRQCIVGPSDCRTTDNSVERVENNDSKENMRPNVDVNAKTQEKKDNNGATNNINWFINWKIYIKHNKMHEKSKPGNNDEMEDNEETRASIEIPKLADPGQSILRYFKPVLSPIKEQKN